MKIAACMTAELLCCPHMIGTTDDALLDEQAERIAALDAEVQSKNEQIGALYKVCNERDVIKNASERLRAALLLAQAFMPPVRREMPFQANLEDAHKVVAAALEQSVAT